MENKRNTIQRQLIYDAVKELNIHATAEQVFEYVVKKYPTISKATVYRNLSQMAESGELLNAGNLLGSTRYDHNCHEHYHFACEACKKVFDVEDDFSDVIEKLRSNSGFAVAYGGISFIGVCKGCAV